MTTNVPSYSCPTETTTITTSLSLRYEYEIVIRPDTKIDDDELLLIQRAMLKSVARVSGLVDCAVDDTVNTMATDRTGGWEHGWRKRNMIRHRGLERGANPIVGLSSETPDSIVLGAKCQIMTNTVGGKQNMIDDPSEGKVKEVAPGMDGFVIMNGVAHPLGQDSNDNEVLMAEPRSGVGVPSDLGDAFNYISTESNVVTRSSHTDHNPLHASAVFVQLEFSGSTRRALQGRGQQCFVAQGQMTVTTATSTDNDEDDKMLAYENLEGRILYSLARDVNGMKLGIKSNDVIVRLRMQNPYGFNSSTVAAAAEMESSISSEMNPLTSSFWLHERGDIPYAMTVLVSMACLALVLLALFVKTSKRKSQEPVTTYHDEEVELDANRVLQDLHKAQAGEVKKATAGEGRGSSFFNKTNGRSIARTSAMASPLADLHLTPAAAGGGVTRSFFTDSLPWSEEKDASIVRSAERGVGANDLRIDNEHSAKALHGGPTAKTQENAIMATIATGAVAASAWKKIRPTIPRPSKVRADSMYSQSTSKDDSITWESVPLGERIATCPRVMSPEIHEVELEVIPPPPPLPVSDWTPFRPIRDAISRAVSPLGTPSTDSDIGENVEHQLRDYDSVAKGGCGMDSPVCVSPFFQRFFATDEEVETSWTPFSRGFWGHDPPLTTTPSINKKRGGQVRRNITCAVADLDDVKSSKKDPPRSLGKSVLEVMSNSRITAARSKVDDPILLTFEQGNKKSHQRKNGRERVELSTDEDGSVVEFVNVGPFCSYGMTNYFR